MPLPQVIINEHSSRSNLSSVPKLQFTMAPVMFCVITNNQEGTTRKFIQCQNEEIVLNDFMTMNNIPTNDVHISASTTESGPWTECQLDHPMSGLIAFNCKFIKVTPIKINPAVVPQRPEENILTVMMRLTKDYSYLPKKKQ